MAKMIKGTRVLNRKIKKENTRNLEKKSHSKNRIQVLIR